MLTQIPPPCLFGCCVVPSDAVLLLSFLAVARAPRSLSAQHSEKSQPKCVMHSIKNAAIFVGSWEALWARRVPPDGSSLKRIKEKVLKRTSRGILTRNYCGQEGVFSSARSSLARSRSLARSFSLRSLARSLTRLSRSPLSLARSLACSLVRSLAPLFARSLASLARSLVVVVVVVLTQSMLTLAFWRCRCQNL